MIQFFSLFLFSSSYLYMVDASRLNASTYIYNPLDWVDGYYYPYIRREPYFISDIIYNGNKVLDPVSLPPISNSPGAGLRTPLVLPEYVGTAVHHLITLPDDWSAADVAAGKRWPVIAVYAGNYAPSLGSYGRDYFVL